MKTYKEAVRTVAKAVDGPPLAPWQAKKSHPMGGTRGRQGLGQPARTGRGLALDAGTVVRALFMTIDRKV